MINFALGVRVKTRLPFKAWTMAAIITRECSGGRAITGLQLAIPSSTLLGNQHRHRY